MSIFQLQDETDLDVALDRSQNYNVNKATDKILHDGLRANQISGQFGVKYAHKYHRLN